MKQGKKIVYLCTTPLLLLTFMFLTDPYKLPLVLIIVPFLLLSVTVYQFASVGLQPLPAGTTKKRYLSIILSALIVLVVVLQSLHQLSIKDFLILAALLAGIAFYVQKIDL
jgi:hypothetical protein